MSETKEARAARLKAALRDNLKRRKAQARERAGNPGTAQPDRDGSDEKA